MSQSVSVTVTGALLSYLLVTYVVILQSDLVPKQMLNIMYNVLQCIVKKTPCIEKSSYSVLHSTTLAAHQSVINTSNDSPSPHAQCTAVAYAARIARLVRLARMV